MFASGVHLFLEERRPFLAYMNRKDLFADRKHHLTDI
jgi:hypothetical protein